MNGQGSTVVILRHGKAAPHDAYPTDHARPLVARGHAEAEFIGHHLVVHGPRPDVVISSPVLRALTTAQIVARHLGVPLEIDDRLTTDTRAEPIVEMLSERLRDGGCVLVAGHNPTLSELLVDLLGPREKGRGDLHTGEAAVLGFAAGVRAGSGAMIDRVRLEADRH